MEKLGPGCGLSEAYVIKIVAYFVPINYNTPTNGGTYNVYKDAAVAGEAFGDGGKV